MRSRAAKSIASIFLIGLISLTACARHSSASLTSDATIDGVTAIVADASIDAVSVRRLILIAGQSNARGIGNAADIDPAIAAPYPAVLYATTFGNDANPPLEKVYPVDALGPRIDMGGVNRFGIELTMGRTLDAAVPGGFVIGKFAFDSTSIAGEWSPTGAYPTIPAGGPNLFTQLATFEHDLATATGSELAAFVWIQSESDALNAVNGSLYGMRLAMFIGAVRFAMPSVPFIYARINAANAGAGTAQTRSGQEANQRPGVIMVDTDAFGLQSDHAHFTSASLVGLGPVFAQTILGAL